MRYEWMFPGQVRRAIDEHWPCVLPMGVLEYHGEHLALGMDTLAVDRCLALLEKEMNVVVLPPFYYGAASYAVAGPERNGTVHVDSDRLQPLAYGIFSSLLRVGFRNIHGIVHHQSENFEAGMPTDLAFRTAARKAIFDYLDHTRGEGWWGKPEMREYYAPGQPSDNPFNWIRFHPLMDERIIRTFAFDHAGIGETSLMMALCPEAVNMEAWDPTAWYTESAKDASPAFGGQAVALLLNRLKEILV